MDALFGSLVAVFGVGSVLIFSTLDLTAMEVVLLVCILFFSVAVMLLFEIISYIVKDGKGTQWDAAFSQTFIDIIQEEY